MSSKQRYQLKKVIPEDSVAMSKKNQNLLKLEITNDRERFLNLNSQVLSPKAFGSLKQKLETE